MIADRTGHLTGQALYEKLLEKYHLQMEMATDTYVLAMLTVADSAEGYERLTKALLEIDAELSRQGNVCERQSASLRQEKEEDAEHHPQKSCHLHAAWDAPTEEVPLLEAQGRTAGEFINLYPPGIPLLVPGEVFSKELCEKLRSYLAEGLNVQGINCEMGACFVKVLTEKRV